MFCAFVEWCKIFKGCKMNCSCLCVCCTTMRLLLNVFHLILQHFTVIAQFINFYLPCFATNIYALYKYLCFDRLQQIINWARLLQQVLGLLLDLHSTVCYLALVIFLRDIFSCIQLYHLKSVGNGWYIYPPLTRTRFVPWNTWLPKHCMSNHICSSLMVRYPDHFCNRMALSFNNRFHCTTVAYKPKTYCKN